VKYQYTFITKLGTFTADPQEGSKEDYDEAIEALKRPLSYISFPIEGVMTILKGACVKNCIIQVKTLTSTPADE